MGIQLPNGEGHSSPPPFSTHVYCGQTAGWIRIPVGTAVGIGPGDIVLDGDSAAPSTERGTASPTFRPMSIVAKRSAISPTAELLFQMVSVRYLGFLKTRIVQCAYTVQKINVRRGA